MTHFKMVQKYQTPLNLCRNNTKPESKRVQFNRFRICVKLFTLKILCHKSKHPWISGNGKAKCRCIYCIRYGTCGCASQNITSEVLQAENESKSVSWEVPRSQLRSEHSNPRGDFRAGRGRLDPGVNMLWTDSCLVWPNPSPEKIGMSKGTRKCSPGKNMCSIKN